MTNYIIGVDGGGTKTLALLADLDGNILARGAGGPSNANAIGFEAACAAIETAIAAARQAHSGEIAALCLGLAGAGRKEDVERFQNWSTEKFPQTKVKVVSDAEILLAAGSPSGPALALICGTGSIAYGRTAAGELIRAGGWGYLFGDEGSGFAIGAAALRAVMQAYDGRGQPTLLTELVLERRGLKTPPELMRNIYGAESPRSEVASLSDLVEQAAGQDDPVALVILETSARELAETVRTVYRQLGSIPIPLALTGGVVLHGTHFVNQFRLASQHLGLKFSAIHEIHESALGAVYLARKLKVNPISKLPPMP